MLYLRGGCGGFAIWFYIIFGLLERAWVLRNEGFAGLGRHGGRVLVFELMVLAVLFCWGCWLCCL